MTESIRASAGYKLVEKAPHDAPWLVMVHGISQDHRVFDRQIETFAPNYRIVLIDLPGHGLSAQIGGPYGIPEFAASVSGALRDAGISKSHFWGTHMGAAAGLFLACSSPELFHSLILESPVFPGRPMPSVIEMRAKIEETAHNHGMAKAREVWWQEGGWFDVMRQRPHECRADEQQAIIADFEGRPWMDAALASSAIPPIDQALAELTIPVLLMNGEHDLEDFIQAAGALGELTPNCERATISEAGGFPLWEFPDAVNKAVQNFLDRKAVV